MIQNVILPAAVMLHKCVEQAGEIVYTKQVTADYCDTYQIIMIIFFGINIQCVSQIYFALRKPPFPCCRKKYINLDQSNINHLNPLSEISEYESKVEGTHC